MNQAVTLDNMDRQGFERVVLRVIVSCSTLGI